MFKYYVKQQRTVKGIIMVREARKETQFWKQNAEKDLYC
jgi:hypothetical protein